MIRITAALVVLCLACMTPSFVLAAGMWRGPANSATLENDSIKARFQAGMLCALTDKHNGKSLLLNDPSKLPPTLPLFGPTHSMNLDTAKVEVKKSARSITTTWTFADGTTWNIDWSLDTKSTDLVLHSDAHAPSPIDEFRFIIPGSDITQHAMVWIAGYGVGQTANAPWNDAFLGDPEKDGSPIAFPHPLVALFQGADSGWFIEGRDERIGPACVMAKGSGDRVTLGMVRRFAVPTDQPKMYEVRIRTYDKQWTTAVDPYVKWLEDGAGFVPFDKLPEKQAWVAKLKTQAYIVVGDYKGVEDLAKRVNPNETFIGRQGEFLRHGFDIGYPDYSITEDSIKWAKRCRELGFHVGMHFNSKSVSAMFPELVKRFKPGFAVVGKDANGNDQYESIYEGQNKLYRVSAALKDWRDYLIDQMHFAVDAGVDVIYLDEAMSPAGKFVVDGVDGYQGSLLLIKEILERYPNVAVETEQFNPLTAKYGKLALSQMPLGHPLAGYIFQRYVKVVPEGLMYSPTSTMLQDASDVWGFMLPGADTAREDSWMLIAEAFHRYQLAPDGTMPRTQVTTFKSHYTYGWTPVMKPPVGDEVQKLFGFKGTNGVTAYMEKAATKRALVVYEPGKEPQWIGTRHFGIRKYVGPGVPAYFGYRQPIRDWLIYDGDAILGLDPEQSYWFDASVKRSPDRFHVFKVPDDFAGIDDMETRTAPQEFTPGDKFFYVNFSGHGEIGAYVPPDYDAYLNGQKLQVDAASHRATARVDADKLGPTGLSYHIELAADQPAVKDSTPRKPFGQLIVFRRTDVPLDGLWVKLPWLGSIDNAKWVTGDGAIGYRMNVGAIGRIIGTIPTAKSVRIKGAYSMIEGGTGAPGDGIIRINGKELVCLPHGEKPYQKVPFDIDLSSYMGQHVILEFIAAGSVRGAAAEWAEPRFEVEK